MRTQEIKIYTFEELSKESKQNAINNYRESYDAIDLDLDIEEIKNNIEFNGFSNVVFYYSGFGNQGDGASFTAKVDIEYWIKETIKNGEHFLSETETSQVVDYFVENVSAKIERTRHLRYHHENTTELVCECYDDNERYDVLYNDFCLLIERARHNLSVNSYSSLELLYDGYVSDEYISDVLSTNDYEFLQHGEFYN